MFRTCAPFLWFISYAHCESKMLIDAPHVHVIFGNKQGDLFSQPYLKTTEQTNKL